MNTDINIDNEWMNSMEWSMCQNNMEYFMTEILGYDVKPFHKEWINMILSNHRNCIICSRDHGKSILVSLVYPLWHMIFSPQINPLDKIDNYNTVIVSNSQNQSTELISRIKTEIETNDYLSTISFDRTNKARVKMLEKGNRNKIDSLSFGSSIRGLHPRIVIVDDPLNERDSLATIYKFFFADMLPLVKHDGYMHVVGTPFSFDDLYSELKKPEKHFNVATYPAINGDTEEVLWPERWSYEDLMERKALQGDWLFSQEYLCNPVDDSTSIFPADLVNGCIDTRIGFQEYPRSDCRYTIGVDWSIGTKSSSDYAVVTVLEDDMKGHVRIANVWRENQVDYDVQIDALLKFNDFYKPSRIFIEDNAFQAIFKQILSKQKIPVKGYTTTQKNKEKDVFALHSAFENKRLTLPKGTPISKELMDRLQTELLAFGYKDGKLKGLIGHDDMVMSLVIAMACAASFPTVINEGVLFHHAGEKVMDIEMGLDMNKFEQPFYANDSIAPAQNWHSGLSSNQDSSYKSILGKLGD